MIYKELINPLCEKNTELFCIKLGGTYSSQSTFTVQITGNSRIGNSYITPAVRIY
jgi:hypothetical protein